MLYEQNFNNTPAKSFASIGQSFGLKDIGSSLLAKLNLSSKASTDNFGSPNQRSLPRAFSFNKNIMGNLSDEERNDSNSTIAEASMAHKKKAVDRNNKQYESGMNDYSSIMININNEEPEGIQVKQLIHHYQKEIKKINKSNVFKLHNMEPLLKDKFLKIKRRQQSSVYGSGSSGGFAQYKYKQALKERNNRPSSSGNKISPVSKIIQNKNNIVKISNTVSKKKIQDASENDMVSYQRVLRKKTSLALSEDQVLATARLFEKEKDQNSRRNNLQQLTNTNMKGKKYHRTTKSSGYLFGRQNSALSIRPPADDENNRYLSFKHMAI